MSQLDYIHDLAEFTPLRDRANAGIQLLASKQQIGRASCRERVLELV